MSKKLFLVACGIVWTVVIFFLAMKYGENSNKDTVANNARQQPLAVNENKKDILPKKTLSDVILTYHPFSSGEERQLERLPEENIDQNVGIGLIDEVKYIVDDKNKVIYKFYRAGQGDVPPHYSSGRVIVWVQTIGEPPYAGGLFDTEITEIEPFGTIELLNNLDGVVLNCSKQSPININDCKYSISFSQEKMSLLVKKLK